jgi:8-oxo-dGTP pyrophosphatase MutT (NUDIX family)
MTDPALAPFFRHIAACNTAQLPGNRVRFLLGSEPVGWLGPTAVAALEAEGLPHTSEGVSLPEPDRLLPLAERLSAAGLFRNRRELFDVRSRPDGRVLSRIDRGAIPFFGIFAEGVHLNALVRRDDELLLWVGRRADNKLLDPGKLDHLVAGGIAAGHGVRDTLEKEGAEEAGLTPELAARAAQVGTISYTMERPEGLRRDRLHCFDLLLPEDFKPVPHDGEVAEFFLLPLTEAFRLVRDTDRFKFNVNLVLTALFMRHQLIDETTPDGRRLKEMLQSQLV